jgi:ribosomal protein S18 acetylase RimI-like enzyme
MTLSAQMTALIRSEQERQGNRFIEGVEIEAYLRKLETSAEVVSASANDGRCRGLVAFYANDTVTRRAYVTLVVVDPSDRGTGLGRELVESALATMKERGLTSCRLEVARDNAAASSLYASIGFQVIEERGRKDLMEIAL